jgi:hypothetical protein
VIYLQRLNKYPMELSKMVTLKINIVGIAVCYFKESDNLFKVLFPFDTNHRVKLRAGNIYMELGSPNCRVSVTNAETKSEFPNFGGFLDITSPGKTHESVKTVEEWEKHGVLLGVTGAKFSELASTFCRFGLNDKRTGARALREMVIGYSGQLELKGSDIVMNVSSGSSTFPIRISADTEIVFDNSCLTCPGENQSADFDMIYSVLEDKQDATKQFFLARHPDDMPKPSPGGTQGDMRISALQPGEQVETIPSIGRIGHVDNNPLRATAGLPCNIVVATNPEGLP